MADPIEIHDWSPEWAAAFEARGATLRSALGDTAIRIDHIGSTSIHGLAAKPIIDIQISVADFEPFAAIEGPMTRAGYVWRADNPELTKRYFREASGARTHVHVRRAGSWHEQWALLFRDYMRAHPGEHPLYEDLKRRLAIWFVDDRTGYTEGKTDFFWEVIRRADQWASDIGWRPGPTDA